MDKKKFENKKMNSKAVTASKNTPAENSALNTSSNIDKRRGIKPNETIKLNLRYPDPHVGFEPLSGYLIHFLTKFILKYIYLLNQVFGAKVDSTYWGSMTTQILDVRNRDEALIIPARAGAGKSTWILAFILALCELYLAKNPILLAIGGVMLVIQKVETLNEILDKIEHFFPGRSKDVMVAMQGWSKSGQEHGFCQNKQVTRYKECQKRSCPFAQNCKVLAFAQKAESAFIIGMTQNRFAMLRETGSIDRFLYWTPADHDAPIPRRYLIFDEKFDMSQQTILDVPQINKASTEIEQLAKSRRLPDSHARSIQNSLSFHVMNSFQNLRKILVSKREGKVIDMPFGLCRLDDVNLDQLGYEEFRNSFQGYRRSYLTPAVQTCFRVMDRLYEKQSLFVKSSGFSVMCTEPRTLLFGNAQTIIFDATAEVDGDYLNLEQGRFLPSSPPLHMNQVTFHIYDHPNLNVSKTAMKKLWKFPAFTTLIEELINQWNGDVFLCTYKDYSKYFPQQFSEAANQRIVKMPNKEQACVPYFGGTNGANNFNQCTNVILLGYPRLSPTDYLQKAYAAWEDTGFQNEILNAVGKMEYQDEIRKDAFRELPMLSKYENMHLAARLEQEIYRCALRNAVCNKQINVVLFCPPKRMCEILLDRFHGCHVRYYEDLPTCVAFYRDSSRSYGGKPTAYNKLAKFFSHWDGESMKSSDLRQQLDISQSAWKDLMKSERTKKLLEDYKVKRNGRGPNTIFCHQQELCA